MKILKVLFAIILLPFMIPVALLAGITVGFIKGLELVVNWFEKIAY